MILGKKKEPHELINPKHWIQNRYFLFLTWKDLKTWNIKLDSPFWLPFIWNQGVTSWWRKFILMKEKRFVLSTQKGN